MKGSMLDIRMLDEISRRYDVEVYLFFEEDLARTRTLESVLEEFDPVPEYGTSLHISRKFPSFYP